MDATKTVLLIVIFGLILAIVVIAVKYKVEVYRFKKPKIGTVRNIKYDNLSGYNCTIFLVDGEDGLSYKLAIKDTTCDDILIGSRLKFWLTGFNLRDADIKVISKLRDNSTQVNYLTNHYQEFYRYLILSD